MRRNSGRLCVLAPLIPWSSYQRRMRYPSRAASFVISAFCCWGLSSCLSVLMRTYPTAGFVRPTMGFSLSVSEVVDSSRVRGYHRGSRTMNVSALRQRAIVREPLRRDGAHAGRGKFFRVPQNVRRPASCSHRWPTGSRRPIPAVESFVHACLPRVAFATRPRTDAGGNTQEPAHRDEIKRIGAPHRRRRGDGEKGPARARRAGGGQRGRKRHKTASCGLVCVGAACVRQGSTDRRRTRSVPAPSCGTGPPSPWS